MPTTVRAVVLDAPGHPEALEARGLLVLAPEAGQVLIKVEAYRPTPTWREE